MATYVVGDIQGCLAPLQRLLQSVKFAPGDDVLWIAGDLVNRGPESLEALRFARALPKLRMVLGNHDLHLLAAAHGARAPGKKDTLGEILNAPDRDALLDWLQQQPLVVHDAGYAATMVHAGIPPIWDLPTALARAAEVEAVLRSPDAAGFYHHMYGNQPDLWSDTLVGHERLRLITNYFTRMRFCDAEGRLELGTKTGPENAPEGFAPWFSHAQHKCRHETVLFGHWATLQGKSGIDNLIALDTGCVWGGQLSMIRLDDRRFFRTECRFS